MRQGGEGDVQETDGETNDEDNLVAVDVAHEHAGHDAEHGERNRLRLVEVRRVEERPRLRDDDERVQVRLREVERDLRASRARCQTRRVGARASGDERAGRGRTKSMKPIQAAMTTVRFVR